MSQNSSSLPEILASAWPTSQWCDVNLMVALSGGPDSVALLRALVALKQEAGGLGIVAAAHVDHGLRGEDSAEDARWCQQLCDQLSVPLQVLRSDTIAEAEQQGDGLEAAARTQRYQLLTDAAEQQGARYLVIAHTADDQVETVLMRMLRGAGLRGLSGIPRTRPLTPTLSAIRPLLACSRAMIEEYLSELGQDYRTDATNQSLQFTRNRVRHELLPLLREHFSSDLNSVLLRLADQSADMQALIEQQARSTLAGCEVCHSQQQVSLHVRPLAQLPAIVGCEALRIVWRDAKLAEQAMTYDWWQRLRQVCTEPAVLNLPGNVRAEVDEGRLTLSW